MKVKSLSLLLCIVFIVSIIAACDMTETRPSEAVMPYSSEEYENGDWTVNSLVEHFEHLGFKDIETEVEETIYREKEGIDKVEIEIYPSNSWFTEYRRIAKGDTYETHRKIYIKATTYVSTITADNNSEFAKAVNESKENAYQVLEDFLAENEGEYLEFDATVVRNGRPESDAKGMYVWFAIEHGNAILYKNGVAVSDFGVIEGGNYGVGAKVHILGIIKKSNIKILRMIVTEPQDIVSDETITNNETATVSTEIENTTKADTTSQNYVLNKSTKKFHNPYCRYTSNIKAVNRIDFNGTREKVIAKGYSPCETCNP